MELYKTATGIGSGVFFFALVRVYRSWSAQAVSVQAIIGCHRYELIKASL